MGGKPLDQMYNCETSELPKSMIFELEDYLLSIRKRVKAETIKLIATIILKVYCYIYSKFGITSAADITYGVIYDLYENCVLPNPSVTTSRVMYYTGYLLQYLYNKGKASYGMSIVVSFILKCKGAIWHIEDKNVLFGPIERSLCEKVLNCSREEYQILTRNIICFMADSRYSKSRICDYNNAYGILYLFLEENNCLYSSEIALAWQEHISTRLPKSLNNALRRGIFMLNDYLRTGEIHTETYYGRFEKGMDNFPDWCKDGIQTYLGLKKLEGSTQGTLKTQRSQLTRFCSYIVNSGLNSFAEITPDILKQFNISDIHISVKAKNEHNITVRQFIRYLYDSNLIDNQYLYAALPTVCSEGETIVNVLNPHEIKIIFDAVAPNSNKLSLLDKALLLIGLKMGLRPIDIVNLKLDDINWVQRTVKFIQKKTRVEASIPMPVDVGNAIYRYITQARPKTDSRYIFVPNRVNRESYCTVTCLNALKKILPEHGFRILRKTFATQTLRSGTGIHRVAELLGHSSMNATHKYLALDEERIMKCAMSLEEIGLPIVEDFDGN